ncbi:hypothetical protein F4780DRAFT_532092 [Xylariomycetidae sp. FL0641]|nr:hypothetical protein F4780DRAFT_532092 [Xylariomycetidae sp. FL0641]
MANQLSSPKLLMTPLRFLPSTSLPQKGWAVYQPHPPVPNMAEAASYSCREGHLSSIRLSNVADDLATGLALCLSLLPRSYPTPPSTVICWIEPAVPRDLNIVYPNPPGLKPIPALYRASALQTKEQDSIPRQPAFGPDQVTQADVSLLGYIHLSHSGYSPAGALALHRCISTMTARVLIAALPMGSTVVWVFGQALISSSDSLARGRGPCYLQ